MGGVLSTLKALPNAIRMAGHGMSPPAFLQKAFKGAAKLAGAKGGFQLTPLNGRSSLSGKPGKSLRVLVGPVQKNWEEAKKKDSGFRELGGKPSKGGHRLGVMFAVKKNWEEAKNPKNHFQELGTLKFGKSGHGLKLMGAIKKNWEEALNPENGFRELTWRRGTSPSHGSEGVEMDVFAGKGPRSLPVFNSDPFKGALEQMSKRSRLRQGPSVREGALN